MLNEAHITSTTHAECDERLRDAEVKIAALEAENDRLLATINQHANDCVKCGDCGFWDKFERPLEGGDDE